jgi:Raf kinase inhibitor-like YbhB/YbcL family protein
MLILTTLFLTIVGSAVSVQRGHGEPPAGQRGGRGGGRGGMTTMSLITTAWADGGQIPIMYTQAGNETSPAIQWSGAPAGTVSFVLVFHDIDAPTGDGTGDILHWLVWNIPGSATSIAQGRPDRFQMEDGSRQISVNGFRYRGPGAPSTGPFHHYVMELYALDTMLDITVTPPGTQAPNPNVNQIRTQIFQAMATHIRGKAAYVGRFRRP